jgi:CubicO group peptidase (beta-lactamase class C family)
MAIAAANLRAPSAQTPAAPPQSRDARIETAVTALMKRRFLPSVSVAVVANNQIVFTRAFGVADQEHAVAASPQTVYRIASVSKPLTAVAAMQLSERGALDLDAPVQRYARTFPEKGSVMTVRQVLAHLGGIRGYRRGEGERTDRFVNLEQALRVFQNDPLAAEPGTQYVYSTFGYTLLGAIIEGASGMPYDEYMRRYVFEPAGMRLTRVDDNFAIVPNRARGYTPRTFAVFDGNYRNAILMDSSYKIPGGGLLSTADDLARFAIGVNRGTLLKAETLALMSRNQTTRDGALTGYGLGWYVGTRPGRSAEGSIWHGGVQPGFTGELWLLPSRGCAVAILANLEGGEILGLAALANEIADIVLGAG